MIDVIVMILTNHFEEKTEIERIVKTLNEFCASQVFKGILTM